MSQDKFSQALKKYRLKNNINTHDDGDDDVDADDDDGGDEVEEET